MTSTPPFQDNSAEKTAPAQGWQGWRGEGCVLVIDDDDAIRAVLARALTKLGFTTAVASEGDSALSIFGEDPERFTLVLLDYKLPGMDSKDVFHAIRQRRVDLPVILMSGYHKEEAVKNSSGMEIAGFIHKPFTMDALVSELRSVLSTTSSVLKEAKAG
jgi:two-component system cell cycle sensor histidine kinase/response regulator CckA